MTPETAAATCGDGRSFPRERLRFIDEIERWHFWFTGRRYLVMRLLANARLQANARVLDAGCGTGAMVGSLRADGYRAVGVDPFAAGSGRPPVTVPIAAGDGRDLPIGSASCEAIVTLDVLEHTDDVRMLREIHRVLRPGGTLILTVPALPWLWSFHDDRAGHLRRYTRPLLRDRLAGTGFDVDECHYYQCLLLPLVVVARLGRRKGRTDERPETPSRLVNGVLRAITRLEVSLGRWISWPVGSTLAVRCHKVVR